GAIRCNAINNGQQDGAAMHKKYYGVNHDRENEIGNWARGDDCRPLPDFLGTKTYLSFLCGHGLHEGFARYQSVVSIAMELNKASKPQCGDPPMGAVAIIKAIDLRPKAKRKGFDLDPAPAADQKMAQLVEEHHQAQNKKKRQKTPGNRPNICKHGP